MHESEEGKWVRSRGKAEEVFNRKQRNERGHRSLLCQTWVLEVTRAFTFSTEVREPIEQIYKYIHIYSDKK